MKALNTTKKILIFCIGLNVVVFASYGLLFWNIKIKNDRIGTLLQEVDADIRRDESLRSIKGLMSQNQEFLSQIDSFFVSPDGVVDFINYLENLGREAGVSLSIGSVDVEPNKNTKDFKDVLRVRLETSGSWSNNFFFLSALENMPYRAQFDRVSFNISGASESLLFKESSFESRTRAQDETWKGSFEIRVVKLR